MASKYTLNYLQYINESEDASPLRGYPAGQIISRIEELMEAVSDKIRFGVPSDNLGRATTYRDANGAIQRIKDILHYYNSKNEKVRFYCWSVSYSGSWKATKNLKAKINSAGGFGESSTEDSTSLNINLKKLIDYFTENPEDSDNLQSISISIDSPSIRKAMAAPDKDLEMTEEPQPTEQKPEASTEE